MRGQDQLLGSRTRVTPRYAVLPLEGIPFSRLPEWPQAQVRVLAGPALGAGFAEYLIELPAGSFGSHMSDGRIEFFLYVLSGGLTLKMDNHQHALGPGGYAFVPARDSFRAVAKEATSFLLLRKRYEEAPGVSPCASLVGNQADVPSSIYYGDPGARLQELLPGGMPFDMAMNIFTFDTGHSLPVTETHVMEHGLYMLQGKGVYFLGDAWMEVEATDFIWMGPFCPQSYYATGPLASQYIYYKNVNREIPL
jgi:(S)-ureidoglycine aminohydrolase